MSKFMINDLGITIFDDDKGSASITSDLKVKEETVEDIAYNSVIDGIESLMLAHWVAGVEFNGAYIDGVETAIEALGNNS